MLFSYLLASTGLDIALEMKALVLKPRALMIARCRVMVLDLDEELFILVLGKTISQRLNSARKVPLDIKAVISGSISIIFDYYPRSTCRYT